MFNCSIVLLRIRITNSKEILLNNLAQEVDSSIKIIPRILFFIKLLDFKNIFLFNFWSINIDFYLIIIRRKIKLELENLVLFTSITWII